MARATKKKAARRVAVGKAAMRGRPRTEMGKTAKAKGQRSEAVGRSAVNTTARSATERSVRDELPARVEKLERANVTLRAAQRNSQRIAADMAERLSELQDKIDQIESTIATRGAEADPGRAADEVSGEGDHDPGDSVPPGVAVSEPEPPRDEDRRILEHLNEELGPE
jgi:hypothetical protein